MARVFYPTTSVLGAEVNPNMARKQSKAVPEGNDLVPHHDEFGSGEPTMTELHRMLKLRLDGTDKELDELIGKTIVINQRLAVCSIKLSIDVSPRRQA